MLVSEQLWPGFVFWSPQSYQLGTDLGKAHAELEALVAAKDVLQGQRSGPLKVRRVAWLMMAALLQSSSSSGCCFVGSPLLNLLVFI